MQGAQQQQRIAELRKQFIEAQKAFGPQSPQARAAGNQIARMLTQQLRR